jgi:hypothetical protein
MNDLIPLVLAEILTGYAGEEVSFETVSASLANHEYFDDMAVDTISAILEGQALYGDDDTILADVWENLSDYVFAGGGIEPIILNLP